MKTKFTITGTDGYESPTKCCKMIVYGDDVSDGTYSMKQLIEENQKLKEQDDSRKTTNSNKEKWS